MTDSPCISSFVIRIIEETNPHSAASLYRGTIRHIQSDEEKSFTSWNDVESFIDGFVPIARMTSGESDVPADSDQEHIKDKP